MTRVIPVSIVAAALAAFGAGPAAAQTATADANTSANAASEFTLKTVDPVHAFGSINVYNVGLEPAQVSAWAKTLNAGQRQEMIGRCAVITQNQQKYFAETANFCQTFAIAVAQSNSGNAGQ